MEFVEIVMIDAIFVPPLILATNAKETIFFKTKNVLQLVMMDITKTTLTVSLVIQMVALNVQDLFVIAVNQTNISYKSEDT